MPFFEEKDYDSIGKKEQSVPDGLMDGTDYYNVFKNLLSELRDLDTNNYESKVVFMMNIVNPAFDSKTSDPDMGYVFNLITAMCYHLIALLNDEESKIQYLDDIERHILPHIENESRAIPYWE